MQAHTSSMKYIQIYSHIIQRQSQIQNRKNPKMARSTDNKLHKSISLVSPTQRYQKKLFMFLCIVWTQIAFNTLINPTVFTNPLLKCSGQIVTQSLYCDYIEGMQGDRDRDCVFQNNWTGTYYAELFCGGRDVRMRLQSIFAMGSIIGLLIMPVISDTSGKLKSLKICLLSILLGNVLIMVGIFYKKALIIGIGQLNSAFGCVSIVPISYSLNSDFFSDQLREKAIIYYCAAWGFTDMSVIFVYYLLPDWRWFMLGLMLVPITAIFFYFRVFFLESPYFFVHAHQFQAAADVLRKLSVINNATQEQLDASLENLKELQKMLQKNDKIERSAKQNLKIVLTTPEYRRALICLIFIKMAYYCFYFGVQGCLQRTGFNFGISIFLLGFGQFTGYMTGTKFIPKTKRKKSLLLTNILTSTIGLLFITKTISQSPFLSSIILYLSFVLNSYNFSALSLVQTQSYTSDIRSTAVGLELGLAFSVRLVIPFAIGFLNQYGVHPIFCASGFVVLLGILPTLVVRQTYGYSNLEQKLIECQELQRIQENKQ